MSRIPLADEVIRVLRGAPDGMTTRQVAGRLGIDDAGKVSARLSRLHAYGNLDREICRASTNDPRTTPARWYVWKLKEDARA